jgi:hypothetical protein
MAQLKAAIVCIAVLYGVDAIFFNGHRTDNCQRPNNRLVVATAGVQRCFTLRSGRIIGVMRTPAVLLCAATRTMVVGIEGENRAGEKHTRESGRIAKTPCKRPPTSTRLAKPRKGAV